MTDQAPLELHNLDRLDLWVSANEEAFTHGPTGIAVIDEAGDIVRVNRALCTLLGQDEPVLVGKPMVEFALQAHHDAINRWLGGEPEDYPPSIRGQAWYRRPDGTALWLDADITRVITPESHYGLVMVHDLTTSKVMQEALRRSHEELDTIVAHAPVAIYKVDPVGRVLLWNAAAEQTFGWSADEVLGHPLPIVEGDGWEAYLGDHLDSLEGHGHAGDEVVRRHRDGRPLNISLWTSPVHDADGEVVAVLAVAADVTERHQAAAAVAQSEERFRTMVQNISDTITVVGPDGRVSSTTGQTKDILGYPQGWWDERHLFDLAHGEDLERAQAMFADVMAAPGEEFTTEIRARHHDGSWAYLELTSVNLLDDPTVNGIVITTRNITQSRRNRELLATQARVLESVASGRGLDETFRELTAMIEDLLPGARAMILVPDGERLVPRTPRRLQLDEPGVLTIDISSPHTAVARAVIAVAPNDDDRLDDEDQRVLQTAERLVSIAIERHDAEQRLVHQGLHDQLTGLPNRTLLLDRLAHAVTRSRHTDQQVAVLFIDLDRFKVVNDSLGHGAGDQLLTHFSERLRRLVRPDDTVARFGGDEFVVVCEHGNGPAVILSIAERLEHSMAEPFNLANGTDVFLTVSMGMAAGTDADAAGLLRNADAAMYRAKDLGRNRLEVFDDAMRSSAVRRLTLGNDLRRAVERREFVVHYQPVLRPDGSIYGAEALVRWQHPERGLLPPNEFIAVTEETGLVVALGEQVLDQALADAAVWQASRPDEPFTVSVNLSARQLAEPDLTGKVKRALDDHDVDPRRLCLELTESVLMADLDHMQEVLLGLKALGIRLAIDDFGTGWSSLTYLHRFPVDEVKIDRSFVTDLGLDSGPGQPTEDHPGEHRQHGQAIVAAVMGMAHALDLQVVAEGVEHPRQLDALADLGCDLAQGFLFSRPLHAIGFTNYLQEHHAPAARTGR